MRRGNLNNPPRLSAARLADLVPAEALVALLSRAAMTGQLATFNERGQEVSAVELTAEQRIRVAENLLGKVMAAPQRVNIEAAPSADVLRDAALVKSVSTEALYAVIQSASQSAQPAPLQSSAAPARALGADDSAA